jgi:hypothetical protein
MRHRLRSLVVPLSLAAAVTALPGLPVATTGPASAAPSERRAAGTAERRIDYRQWSGDTLAAGRLTRAEVRRGAVRIAEGGSGSPAETGLWTSPWVAPGFDLTELVPSWEAGTPGASSIVVEVRGRSGSRTSSWDTISVWAKGDQDVQRTSGSAQTDDLGRVLYDTWLADGLSAYQLRVTLRRRSGGDASPRLETAGAMVSRLPSATGVTTSTPGVDRGAALGRTLAVPRYSQMVHRGSYAQYGGGGEAWCSPTSTAMVLAYYDALPPRSAYSWVRAGHPDPEVVHLARVTYDESYGGTGTWPFNTAYAASRTGSAFVTRLRSLREAERFIAAGIPLVASVRFGSGELSGAPISSTNGHLLVVVGFTRDGDVVVNDPAASSNQGVRRTYDRGQFEDVWLRRNGSGGGGSGGLVYVVRDAAHPVPERTAPHNW